MLHPDLKIPFTDPVLVFAVVLLIILITPILFNRFRIPGIVGLIISGIILGPNGFHILERDNSMVLFGTVGLLYLMFMAGLEMDMNDFRANKNKSIVFGILTSIFPFIMGFSAAHFILDYSVISSILLASMFSTHTLIAYPIVSKLGISQTRTMSVIIGGTIITDAVVLLILAVITNAHEADLSLLFFVKFFSFLGLLVLVILWGVPNIGRWFFRSMESEGHSQFLFVMTVVFLSGFLAHVVGVEPIIGAFLAGLALNQLIPNSSTLMNRIDFVGNSIFIPFFLISVGMIIDLKVLTKGPESILISILIISISFSGKWLAAFATQKIFSFNNTERKLIWGMSTGHAAATIAIVIIGFHLKLLDENVLNATVVLILASCLGSSLIAENAGRQIALMDEQEVQPSKIRSGRILIPLSNIETASRLIDLAVLVRDAKSSDPLLPLIVLENRRDIDLKIKQFQSRLENALKNNAVEISREVIFRIDLNVSAGIAKAFSELAASSIIFGWNGKGSGSVYGHIINKVSELTSSQILITRLLQPINTIKRIVVRLPDNTSRETGFEYLIETLFHLSRNAGTTLEISASSHVIEILKSKLSDDEQKAVTLNIAGYPGRPDEWKLGEHDLLVVVVARIYTISYHKSMSRIPALLRLVGSDTNYIVLFPEQKA